MEYYQKTEMEKSLSIDGLYSFHYFEYVKNFAGIGESHDFWEFVYVDYGTIQIFSDEDSYILNEGEGFLHGPNEFHNVFSVGKYASAVIFSFGCQNEMLHHLCKKVLKIYGEAKNILEGLFQAGTRTFRAPWDIFEQQRLVLAEEAPYGMQQITVMYLEIFLLKMLQNELYTQEPPGIWEHREKADSSVEVVAEILSKHLYDKICMDDICRESGFSKSYIAKIFKNAMDMGVMDYYNHLKIKEAKRMISENSYTFTEIAEKLNYGSVHYFSKFFKKITNMTPTGYRNSIKQKMTI